MTRKQIEAKHQMIEDIENELEHAIERSAELRAKVIAKEKEPLRKRFMARLRTEILEKTEEMNRLKEKVWRMEAALEEQEMY